MSDFSKLTVGAAPRQGEFADKPGCYELVVRVRETNLNPGEKLDGEVFITGYGVIETAKIVVFPSPGVFVDAESEERESVKNCPQEDRGRRPMVFGYSPGSSKGSSLLTG